MLCVAFLCKILINSFQSSLKTSSALFQLLEDFVVLVQEIEFGNPVSQNLVRVGHCSRAFVDVL